MAGLQTPAILAALKTQLFKDFGDALKENAPWSVQNALFTEFPSATGMNTYAWLAAIPHMREWVGPRFIESLKERVFQISNRDFERTLGVKKNELNDGNVASASMAMASLATSAAKLPDDLCLELMQGGQSILCMDGQYLYDTDHPTDLDASGTQANYSASGLALNAANFQTARARMMGFKGENGKAFGFKPDVLAVPPALEKAAHEIVTAETGSSGATNVQKMYGTRVLVINDLDGQDTTWYLFDTKSPGPKALILQRRESPTFVSLTDERDPNVFHRKEFLFGVDARFGAGPGIWARTYKAAA